MKLVEETYYMIQVKNITNRYIDLAGLYSKDEAEDRLKNYEASLPIHQFRLKPYKIKFKKDEL